MAHWIQASVVAGLAQRRKRLNPPNMRSPLEHRYGQDKDRTPRLVGVVVYQLRRVVRCNFDQ